MRPWQRQTTGERIVKTVAIRVDSDSRMGAGHIGRCHSLARELRSRGVAVRFICQPRPGEISRTLREDGFAVEYLDAPPRSGEIRDADWLGIAQELDAAQSRSLMGSPNWVVVDHYGIDAAWEREIRSSGARVLAIDDLANRDHDADVVLDQNWFGDDGNNRYQGLVRDSCELLLGPSYALLRQEFAAHRSRIDRRSRPIRRVLISFSTDGSDVTGRAVKAMTAPALRHIHIDVVAGPTYQHRERLERLVAERGCGTVHGPQPHLADLMASADLAIGGGGVTTWERMCLGLPSLVVTMAENQVAIAVGLHREGLISLVGEAARVTQDELSAAIAARITQGRSSEETERLMSICDGRGCARVTDVMLSPTLAAA